MRVFMEGEEHLSSLPRFSDLASDAVAVTLAR